MALKTNAVNAEYHPKPALHVHSNKPEDISIPPQNPLILLPWIGVSSIAVGITESKFDIRVANSLWK